MLHTENRRLFQVYSKMKGISKDMPFILNRLFDNQRRKKRTAERPSSSLLVAAHKSEKAWFHA